MALIAIPFELRDSEQAILVLCRAIGSLEVIDIDEAKRFVFCKAEAQFIGFGDKDPLVSMIATKPDGGLMVFFGEFDEIYSDSIILN